MVDLNLLLKIFPQPIFYISLHQMYIFMQEIPINRLKAVLAEKQKQANGLLTNYINLKLQFQGGVEMKFNPQ